MLISGIISNKNQKMNPTLFLTGGATGIGRSIAKLFYQKGYNIAFVDANVEESQETTKDWEDSRYLAFNCDVRNLQELENAATQTVDKFGTIDILILNAGIHQSNTVLSATLEEIDNIIDINIKGYIYALKAVLPKMIASGGGNIVVNVSDQAFIGKQSNFGYGLTKGAIAQMVKSISLDYADQGIRISGVCPGTIETPLAHQALQNWADKDFGGDYTKAVEEESKLNPLKRLGTADEVADFFYFLANTKYITGSLHLIDGGGVNA